MRRRLGAAGRAAQRPRKKHLASRRPHGRQGGRGGVAPGQAGLGHGHRYGRLKRHIVELLYVAVLMLGANKRLALVAKYRGLRRLLGGVGVGVQGQNPRLRQQRPHEAEQQEQG